MQPTLDTTRDTTRDPRKTRMPAVALLVLSLIAFSPALLNGYVWDDDVLLTNNVNVRTLAGLWQCWFNPTANLDFYPMTFTSWWIEYKLWGYNPIGYHLVNVLMHGVNAVLVWTILRLLNVRYAWLIAALFAIHPVQVESVTWVAERKNTLSGLFYLLSAWFFLRFWVAREEKTAEPPTDSPRGGAWWMYALALFFYVCAMFAKPLVMTLAAGLVIVMWWRRGGRVTRRDVALSVPFFALAVPMAALTMWVQKHHVGARGDEYIYAFSDRVLVAGRVLCFYVYKLLLPVNLSFAYPRWNIDSAAWQQWLFPAAAVASAMAAWFFRRRLPGGVALYAAMGFFVATLSPALGFINVYWHRYYFVADHMQYLAMIAVAAVVVHGIAVALARLVGERNKQIGGLGAAAAVVALSVCSIAQSMPYIDAETLWRDALDKDDESWIAHNNMGGILAVRGDPDALGHYLRALELAPRAREVFRNAMGALMNRGRFDEAAKLAQWRLTILPNDPNTLALGAQSLASAGRSVEAQAAFRLAVERISARLSSGAAMTPIEQSEAHFRLGESLMGLEKYDEAAVELRKSMEIEPLEGEPAYSLSIALLRADKVRDAAQELRRLVEWERGRPPGGNPEHLARFALVVSASREPGVENLADARAAATLACEMSDGRAPRWLEVLAIVLAAQGEQRAAAGLVASAHALAVEGKFNALADRLLKTRETITRGERVWMTANELASQ